MHQAFPPFIDQLPRAKLEFEGLSGWVIKGDRWLVIFMEAKQTVAVPRHHHGAQWGVVLDGTMELTIGEETRTYERGGAHFIPAGVEHEATLFAGWRGLYVFARPTPDR
jgi:mannose-6-phosphate isomerase-like protein (cupin superfamily)